MSKSHNLAPLGLRKTAETTVTTPKIVGVTSVATQTISLPQGWKREELLRQSGLHTGKTDIFYISPTGQKVRSKAELQKQLGNSYDVAGFDWRSGKFSANRKRSNINEDSTDGKVVRMMEEYQQCLLRSGPSLFGRDKQPIVETTQEGRVEDVSAVKVDNEYQECPRQLFWHKRLADTNFSNGDSNDRIKSIDLPKEIQSAGVPGIDNSQLLQSIVSCIYNSSKSNAPVLGQNQQKSNIEKNPCLSVTTNQPLVKQVLITEEMLYRQEAKVKDLRRKLELVRRSLLPKLKVGDAA